GRAAAARPAQSRIEVAIEPAGDIENHIDVAYEPAQAAYIDRAGEGADRAAAVGNCLVHARGVKSGGAIKTPKPKTQNPKKSPNPTAKPRTARLFGLEFECGDFLGVWHLRFGIF